MIVYGIANCDTVRKARKFFEQNQLDYQFVDFKQQPPSLEMINNWLTQLPIDQLINKRSTSWKQLNDEQKQSLLDQTDLSIIEQMPTLIKRPLIELNNEVLVGFNEKNYQQKML
ncbi:Spx/MgsR family RNA polymerase-binding regulatory protein [Thiomicrorhabdus sediminis]|uniref:Spx/MgsR family RNA polymerase-binding regulatory protein n=1 Tax=Thiomicrorhabdus sediminis TaxID=2580412 RepID=A0A4P9K6W6_9GAMM|nr:Spx/MgsR family RNA polymerase-binding regulatory protein [Thiomicrorhabdus sediminis]QCU90200.1 Spx/MgsR family RNA polymerase-binding regulatory protein [Thiomicrorhabdus sediminis]